MIEHLHCHYAPPWLGDVALLSAVWVTDVGEAHHVAVPVIDGRCWWHWAREAPEEVQMRLEQLWEGVQQWNKT